MIFRSKAIEYLDLVREHWDSLDYIKSRLHYVDRYVGYAENAEYREIALLEVKEAWDELGEDVMKILWRAPRKGSVFTTKERDQLREAASIAERRRIRSAE